jgi:hypothetical protein
MPETNTPAPPADLTPKAQRLWADLLADHAFRRDELAALEHALRLFDDADRLREADQVKLSLDCRNAGLRFWRLLKFTTGEAVRRPGRPSGDDWSAQRRAQARQRVG